MSTQRLIWPALCLLASTNAFADGSPLSVNPSLSAHPGAPASSSNTRSGTGELVVRLHNSCYGTNLRGTSNPLSPNSIIEAKLQLVVQGTANDPGKTVDFWVKYPADIVTGPGVTNPPPEKISPATFGGVEGMRVGMFGNTVQITVPAGKAYITLNADGSTTMKPAADAPPISLGQFQFLQDVYNCDDRTAVFGSAGWSASQPTFACGAYMGKDGPLSFSIKNLSVASDNSSVDLTVNFPGQTGFCGGYFSPLMLFFDEARPHFSGSSKFQLSAAGMTYWVEPNAPGYFLVYDRNGNGQVDGKDELFGDQDSDKNGFEALREVDSNKDGVIDASDKLFKKLLLWNDKNGDGVSQPGELSLLHKRVQKVSLKYRSSVTTYGQTAEARQVSDFWFRDKKGSSQKGVVEDVWFAPVPGGAAR